MLYKTTMLMLVVGAQAMTKQPEDSNVLDNKLAELDNKLNKLGVTAQALTGGCNLNQCRPGGTYTGSYSFTTWKGNPAGCTATYCDLYKPGGMFNSRCSAAIGSFDRGYADEECIGTCQGFCPEPPTPVVMSPCDAAAYQRYLAALKSADDAKARAVTAGATQDATAAAAAAANVNMESLAAAAAKKAADAENLYAMTPTPANQAAAMAAENAAAVAETAAAKSETTYLALVKADTSAATAALAAMDRAKAAKLAADALKTGKCLPAAPTILPPPPACSKDPAFMYSAYGGKVCYNSPVLAARGSGGCGTWCIDDASYFNGDPGAKTCNPKTGIIFAGSDNSAALMC